MGPDPTSSRAKNIAVHLHGFQAVTACSSGIVAFRSQVE
jgi:hypothetical protein